MILTLIHHRWKSKLVRSLWKIVWHFLMNLKTHKPCDSTSLLGINSCTHAPEDPCKIRNRISSRPATEEAERNFSNNSGLSLQAEWPGTFQQPILKYRMGADASRLLRPGKTFPRLLINSLKFLFLCIFKLS